MRNIRVSVFAVLLVAVVGGSRRAFAEDENVVAVYVSLDEHFSRRILEDFEKETGIRVEAKYDVEANKTIGLVRELISQKSKPFADVYWNNELATTVKLRESGVLARYVSPNAADIPTAFKDPDGYWTGFAARARILIVNTNRVAADEFPTSMWDLTKSKWKGQVAMARPVTGTTAAHAAALYVHDEAVADKWFDALIENDLVWRPGNAHVAKQVAAGEFAFGWTDTDDFNVQRLQGKPVAAVYPDRKDSELGVMYIPNSLVLIKGAPHAANGKRLIDWLLRPEVEARLARSRSAQIPVRPGVPVPPHVRRPDQIGKVFSVDWSRTGKEYDRWTGRVDQKIDSAGGGAVGSLLWIAAGVVFIAIALVLLLRRATGEPE